MFIPLIALPAITIILILMSVFLTRKKVLLILMSLELLLLNFFVIIIIKLRIVNLPVSPPLYLLVLGACEASLGLSVLISITRYSGSDIIIKKIKF